MATLSHSAARVAYVIEVGVALELHAREGFGVAALELAEQGAVVGRKIPSLPQGNLGYQAIRVALVPDWDLQEERHRDTDKVEEGDKGYVAEACDKPVGREPVVGREPWVGENPWARDRSKLNNHNQEW